MDLQRKLVVVGTAILVTTACTRKPPKTAPVPAAPSSQPAAQTPSGAATESESARLRDEAAARLRATTAALLIPVHFSFDDSDLDTDAREVLDQKLQILSANANVAILATGHADDRGSDEYNIALGLRRSAAVKRYLTQNGVDATRITTETIGEERPVCTETTEACRARNRRVEFTVVRGAVASPIR